MVYRFFGTRRSTLLAGPSLAILTLACGAQSAQAQNQAQNGMASAASPAGNSAQIADIVVTAERRAVNLQELPVAISAFSGDRLQESGARNVVDIGFLAAGLNFGQERAGVLRTSIRGIGSNVGVETAVAMHLDGVYLANRYDQIGAFMDVERVEVLRGPQGTLYGRNATGGVVNIISNAPSHSLEAGAQLTVGNYQLVEFESYLSGPVAGDKVRARIAVKGRNLPGYGRDFYRDIRVNGADGIAARFKLDIDASETFRIKLSADYSRSNTSGADEVSRAFANLPLSPEARGQFVASGYDSNRNRPNVQSVRAFGGSARLELDLGNVMLTSLTGIRKVHKSGTIDIDASPEDSGYWSSDSDRNLEKTQELNISSTDDGPLQWLAGAFYMDNMLKQRRVVQLPLISTPINPRIIYGGPTEYQTKAWAIYGQASYALAETLNLTLGGRYSKERNRDREERQFIPDPKTFLDQSNSSNAFTPRVTLKWDVTPDVNVYATYAQGFKSGGFNASNNDPSNFRPEKVKNYEVGFKGMFLDRSLLFNAAAFYMDYTDLQVLTSVIIDGIPAVRTTNAATATIKGVEADFQIRPTSTFSIDGNFAYLDAKYGTFTGATDTIGATAWPLPAGEALGALARDASGNQLALAPKFSTNIGAQYEGDIAASWSMLLRGEFSYQSRIYYTPFEDMRGSSQAPVATFNARLQFRELESDWTFAVWGRNLSNQRIISNQIENYDGVFTGAFRSTTYRPPRTFGITIGKTF